MFKWSYSDHMSLFKPENFIQLVPEEGAREISRGERDLMQGKLSIPKLKGHRPGPESSPEELKVVPRQQPARKPDLSPPTTKNQSLPTT